MSTAISQKNCRSCDEALAVEVLDLGLQPLANSLLDSLDDAVREKTFPLDLRVCSACGLMQLGHTVPPSDIFSDYLYFSSVSPALVDHARRAAESHCRDYGLGARSFVVEIASNDGYLLQNFVRLGVPCLGVEPAQNIAKTATEKGIPTLPVFFSENVARSIVADSGRADLILGNNVFAHVPTTNDFVAGMAVLLAPGGRAVLEFPWAHEMVEHLEFDTVYHEHFFYFHLTPLAPLLARHGLVLARVEQLPIHGGSLRVHIAHQGQATPDASVGKLLQVEATAGVGTPWYYENFGAKVRSLKSELSGEIAELRAGGASLAAYGASAKGSTLLNFCGIGRGALGFVVDRSPHKQRKFTPGTHLPILPPEALLERRPDMTLLLTWNFAEEIVAQQQEYLRGGGRFLVPVPHPHTLP
jgi:SAM-dependent methyltransferase